MENPGKRSGWLETTTRYEWETPEEPTTYEGGMWSTQQKITMTITRCGSADTKPPGEAS
ncbi:hypothetical protein ACIP93_22170 [Streptomyces sp. NPDC088745]|uniref:hypothetical protein n=1 Tax=Streptomyces sp. NPDC088745 TaxID=3365884 RepID=UPI00380E983B